MMAIKQRRPIKESKEETPVMKRPKEKEAHKNRSLFQHVCSSLKYVLLVLIVPPFLNYAALLGESKQLMPENGLLYDIGHGQKLYLSCMGTGSPTVVLDAPTGMSSDAWALVQPILAKTTKVCVYDRAGLGFSDRPPPNVTDAEPGDENFSQQLAANKWQPFTVERMADDLHRLITYSSSQEKPLILVGAELGAVVSRFYTQIYESDVSDLVLVDPLVEKLMIEEETTANLWAKYWFGQLLPSLQMLQLSAAVGLSRLGLLTGFMTQPLDGESVPEDVLKRQKHLFCHPKHISSAVDEHHFINETFAQMKIVFMLKQFPQNVSVTVLNGNYYDDQLPSPLNQAWAKSQQLLLTKMHPNSKHILINGADHHMVYRKPEVIAEQIRKVVKSRRLSKAS